MFKMLREKYKETQAERERGKEQERKLITPIKKSISMAPIQKNDVKKARIC